MLACQAPLPMGFPSQEYGSGLPFPSPGDLPDPEIKPASPALAGGFFSIEPHGKSTWKPELRVKKNRAEVVTWKEQNNSSQRGKPEGVNYHHGNQEERVIQERGEVGYISRK